MDQVEGLGYVTIGTTDLDEAIDFYTRVVRLQVTDRRNGTAFLTGGTEHHWIRLEEAATAGATRVAFKVADDGTLSRLRERLVQRGVAVTEGGDFGTDRLEHWIRFSDPAGQEIELYTQMVERAAAPEGAGINLERFLHAVWAVPDFAESVGFYRDVLGFLPSDYIESFAAFMRAGNRFHHGIALLGGAEYSFNHVCILVESIDDVMRARNHALRNGATLRNDVLRHAPSGSIGIYVEDPMHGLAVEYCCGHAQLPDDHVPRRLPAALDTIDVWQAPLPDLVASKPPPSLEELLASAGATVPAE